MNLCSVIRKHILFDGVNALQPSHSQQTSNHVSADVHRVRFYIGASKLYSSGHRTSRSSDLFTDDTTKGFQRSRLSSFKNFFRGNSKRKKRKSLELSEEGLKIDGAIIRKASPLLSRKRPTSVENLDPTDAPEEHHVIVSPGDTDESEPDIVDERVLIKPPVQVFRRTQSTKSRHKPMLEDEDLDNHRIARSVTVGNFLPGGRSYLHPPLHVSRSFGNWTVDSREDGGEDLPEDGNTPTRRGLFDRGNNRNGSRKSKKGGFRKVNLRKTLSRLFARRRKSEGGFNPTHRGSQGGIVGHSLASVELGSWAARGSRRGSALPPFCSTISPTEASSRTEILQTISSSIIHLFQRKPLKDNELGVLQDHVRFLINSEAGGLVHEYYKDQLLRKGMIILREKIKNEQGLELLKQLGETWDYFFKEILPILQAILYPLTSSLGKDETVRSLSLLAFRNIVVLKVSIKEALDSVSKNEYPSSIQQMLLVLQSIQDNVFLSENQFLLEKLVARVVCPYLGQRGVYEGSPDPVIKVKLKPIPFNIPSVIVSDNDKIHSKSPFKMETPSNYSPVSSRKGLQDVRKLKPVLEHIYDGGRRHSIMS
ncbi:uncharacterized protein LOC131951451 [Physella acuta]|uniref:uncharacterized protein LOC131951451 n=1 Tax=Physella acuta TaxID=109671 RepID=UPI0027DDF964|nr:uncharacterized protein LOC131951451 [Physella acuta]